MLLLLVWGQPAVAQYTDETEPKLVTEWRKQANEYRQAQNWTQAIRVYSELLNVYPKQLAMHYQLAYCYMKSGLTEMAMPHLKYIMQADETKDSLATDYKDLIVGMYAQALHYHGEYELADKYYSRALAKLAPTHPQYAEYNLGAMQCLNAPIVLQNPLEDVLVQQVTSFVNGRYDDANPVYSPADTALYFTSHRSDMVKGNELRADFFYTKVEGPRVTFPSRVKKMPAASFSKTANFAAMQGTEFYSFMTDKPIVGFSQLEPKEITTGYVRLRGRESSKFASIKPTMSDATKDRDPFVTDDASRLFFVSARNGGAGGTDLWMATRDAKGVWSKPVNLGSKVNTPYNEVSPYFDRSTKTLYFSSQGMDAMGGYDIFYSEMLNDTSWTEPRNMGYPLNSPGDDVYFRPYDNGRKAYFSSNRKGTNGGLDLYHIVFEATELDILEARVNEDELPFLEEEVYTIKNADSLLAKMEAEMKEQEAEVNKTLEEYETEQDSSVVSEVETEVDTELGHKDEAHELETELENDMNQSLSNFPEFFVERTLEATKQHPEIVKVNAGEMLVLDKIRFTPGTDKFAKGAEEDLNKLFYMLIANPTMRIKITAHTDDATGTPAQQQTLSEKRAIKIVLFLILNKGIDETRLVYNGKGGKEPLVPNSTPEAIERNNRVEVQVLVK